MTDHKTEKREFIRVPFTTDVELQAQGRTIRSGSAIDISMTGLRLLAQQASLPVGTACEVKIFLSGSEPRVVIEAQGTVIRSGTKSLAISFTELDLESYHHLCQLIISNTDKPEQVEWELGSHRGIRKP